LLRSNGVEVDIRQKVARTVPRYLIPRPLSEQADEIVAFAQGGYATVVVALLESSQAVALATKQVQSLADLEVVVGDNLSAPITDIQPTKIRFI